MKPVLFDSTATVFTSQGIGTLECISCIATEERNGIFEVEFKISTDALHYEDCVEGNIVVCIHDDTKTKQPFQIYKRSKPINGIVTVHAEHITYRLAKIITAPFSSGNVSEALQSLKTNAVEDCPFDFWTDKASDGTFRVEQPCSIRSKLGGEQGSILDAFGGGEYQWDHFTVKLYQHRGHDNGVVLRKGKNITDYTKHTDVSGSYTGIVPYYVDNGEVMMLPEKVVRLDGAPAGYTVAVDLSDKFEEKPSESQLREAAETYLNLNAKPDVAVSAKVSFVSLWQTEEYKNIAPLQRVNLCDTVTVVYDTEDTVKTKVVKTVYNVLLERYDEIELGETTTNMTSAIKNITEALTGDDVSKTEMEKALAHAGELITGGLGGFVVFNRNAEGQPQEILIMDTDNKETAVNVIRMNKNGIAFSRNGYNGPFNTAWTIDSRFVADYIVTGTLDAAKVNVTHLNASNITAGTLDAAKVNVTHLNASNITAGTLSADRIYGGSINAKDGSSSFDLDNGRFYSMGSDGATCSILKGHLTLMANGTTIALNPGGYSSIGSNVTITGTLYVGGQATFNSPVIFNKSFVDRSDRKKKNTIVGIVVEKAREFIMRLRPCSFRYNDDHAGKSHHGFIAQEVRDAMGNDHWGVVHTWKENNEDISGIRYNEIISDLVSVVQDQERRIARLEGKA